MPLITLTTDFGTADGYVGTMKGVILGICPDAAIVDLSHGIPPQNTKAAAFLLAASHGYFPKGTVHVVVVDPGVGTDRRAIAVRTREHFFVAPDNGVLSLVLSPETVVEIVHLTNPDFWLPRVSKTFHGRDIFAPVGAHLANGVEIGDLGGPIRHQGDLVACHLSEPQLLPGGSVKAEVVYIDRFGNLITNLPAKWSGEGDAEFVVASIPGNSANPVLGRCRFHAEVMGRVILRLCRSYGEVDPGELIALVGSAGYLEIAVCCGNASRMLGAEFGTEVIIHPNSR
jgi:S-adenosylmethionine hydrolase